MSQIVKIQINPPERIASDVLQGAEAFAAASAMRRMDKYVPFRTGVLSQTAKADGNQVIYDQPYAATMYYGESASGERIHYRHEYHALATSFWDKAMMTAEGDKLVREVTNFIRSGKAYNNGR